MSIYIIKYLWNYSLTKIIEINRLTLSAKNNWIDEIGNVFLIFTRKEVQTILNLSDKTATKAFKQLNECKLIHEHLVKIDEEANMNVKKLNKRTCKARKC